MRRSPTPTRRVPRLSRTARTVSDRFMPGCVESTPTVMPAVADGTEALQISESPRCAFTRRTSDHDSPPPETVVVSPGPASSEPTRATSVSLDIVVSTRGAVRRGSHRSRGCRAPLSCRPLWER